MPALRKLLASFLSSTRGGTTSSTGTTLSSWQGYAVVSDLLALEYDVGKE
jgi:hypothetical protein